MYSSYFSLNIALNRIVLFFGIHLVPTKFGITFSYVMPSIPLASQWRLFPCYLTWTIWTEDLHDAFHWYYVPLQAYVMESFPYTYPTSHSKQAIKWHWAILYHPDQIVRNWPGQRQKSSWPVRGHSNWTWLSRHIDSCFHEWSDHISLLPCGWWTNNTQTLTDVKAPQLPGRMPYPWLDYLTGQHIPSSFDKWRPPDMVNSWELEHTHLDSAFREFSCV